ncbi:unnamed protein product, partial [marine sediment metagenome]
YIMVGKTTLELVNADLDGARSELHKVDSKIVVIYAI